jgi:hypothetical protein
LSLDRQDGNIEIREGGRGSVKTPTKYVASLFVSVVLFAALNLVHFLRPEICSDCFFPYGVPFTFFKEGGYGGGGGFVWYGFLGDVLVVCAVGAALGSARFQELLMNSFQANAQPPEQIEHRRKIQAKGRKHFIVYRGILGFGGSAFILTKLWQWHDAFGWHVSFLTPEMFLVVPFELLVWTVAGYFWGAFMWTQAYAKSTSQD